MRFRREITSEKGRASPFPNTSSRKALSTGNFGNVADRIQRRDHFGEPRETSGDVVAKVGAVVCSAQ